MRNIFFFLIGLGMAFQAAGAPAVNRQNVASELFGSRAELIRADGEKVEAKKLIDGKLGDFDGAGAAGVPATVVIHLPSPCMVNLVRIFPGHVQYAGNPSGETGVRAYAIEVLNNGYWHKVAEAKDQPSYLAGEAKSGDDYFFSHSFKPAKAEAVRLVVLESNDTGRRMSGDGVIPPAERNFYLREIEVYSAVKGEAGVKATDTLIHGDFRLPVYREEERAEIVWHGAAGMKPLKAAWQLTEEKSGGVVAAGELTVKTGENRQSFDLRALPDGRYILALTPDPAEKFVRGVLRRMLRIDRGGRAAPPAEPVEVAGVRVFPVDDYHFAERKGVTEVVIPAETIQASKPLHPDRAVQQSRGSDCLNLDADGNFVMKFIDATRSGRDRQEHYVYSKDLKDWTITDASPTGQPNRRIASPYAPLPAAATPKWGIKTPLDQATLRFHDPARDGMPPLNEVRVHWFPPSRGDVAKYGLTPWGLYPVWEKNAGEWIVLTRTPLLVDKFTFESDELESETDGNDNFAPQFLADDGRTLYIAKAHKVRRFPPFTVEYDGIREAFRIMRTFYSRDGIHWQHRYLTVSNLQDHWSYQHYGAFYQRVDRNFYLGYIWVYASAKQQIYPEIIYSRDGLNFRRLPGATPFVANTPPGTWLFGMIFFESNPLEHGGKYYFPIGTSYRRPHFYHTYVEDISHITPEFLRRSYEGRGLPEQWPYFREIGGWEGLARDMREANASVGLAVMRKDGWIAVRAGEGGGELRSRVFTAAGSGLRLNGRGEFTVEVLDRDGRLLPDYAGANAARFAGDATGEALAWRNGKLHTLPAQPFRLRIGMPPGSELYTLHFFR